MADEQIYLLRSDDPETRVKSGTYLGDGAVALSITGIGFRPKYLKISPSLATDLTGTVIFETWEDVNDDDPGGQSLAHTAIATSEHITAHDVIVSLDDDGFTVGDRGTNQHPNQVGVTYNYLAIG